MSWVPPPPTSPMNWCWFYKNFTSSDPFMGGVDHFFDVVAVLFLKSFLYNIFWSCFYPLLTLPRFSPLHGSLLSIKFLPDPQTAPRTEASLSLVSPPFIPQPSLSCIHPYLYWESSSIFLTHMCAYITYSPLHNVLDFARLQNDSEVFSNRK